METRPDLKVDLKSFVKWFNLTLKQYNSVIERLCVEKKPAALKQKKRK